MKPKHDTDGEINKYAIYIFLGSEVCFLCVDNFDIFHNYYNLTSEEVVRLDKSGHIHLRYIFLNSYALFSI
jgi:hypothetical protein